MTTRELMEAAKATKLPETFAEAVAADPAIAALSAFALEHNVTVLTPAPFPGDRHPPRMSKSWTFAAGVWADKGAPKPSIWKVSVERWDSIDAVLASCVRLSKQKCVLIHGERNDTPDPVEYLLNKKTYPTPKGYTTRDDAHFYAVARGYVILDVDKTEVTEQDGDKAAAIVRSEMPAPFNTAACVWGLTSGHGFKKTARLRLIFLLSRPLFPGVAYRFASSSGVIFDPSLFNTVQEIYVQPPRITGAADPVAVRWGKLDGEARVAVPDDVENIAPKPAETLDMTAPTAPTNLPHNIRAVMRDMLNRRPVKDKTTGAEVFNRRNNLDKMAQRACQYAVEVELALALARAYVFAPDETHEDREDRTHAENKLREICWPEESIKRDVDRLHDRGLEMKEHWANVYDVLEPENGESNKDYFDERFRNTYKAKVKKGEYGKKDAEREAAARSEENSLLWDDGVEDDDMNEEAGEVAAGMSTEAAVNGTPATSATASNSATREAAIAFATGGALDADAARGLYGYMQRVGATGAAVALAAYADALDDSDPMFAPDAAEQDRLAAAARRAVGKCVLPPAGAAAAARIDAKRQAVAKAKDEGKSVLDEVEHLGGDVAHARQFARVHGERVKWLRDRHCWIVWNGSAWVIDGAEEAAMRLIQEQAAEQYVEAVKVEKTATLSGIGEEAAKAAVADAKGYMRSGTRIKAALEMARAQHAVEMRFDEFDRDPWVLGVQNGMVDLRTGTLEAPDPSQRITRRAGCAFDPKAKAPKFEAFLKKVLPDADVREYLQTFIGYCLTGSTAAECFLFLEGGGQNGKSTLIEIVHALLGGYAVALKPETIMKNSHMNSEVDRSLSRLPGARIAVMSEPPSDAVWNDGKVKQLASTDNMEVRRLRENAFEFRPTHKLMLASNHKPGVRDASDGFWRRMKCIPFYVRISAAERDDNLKTAIVEAELSGVLNWALEGLRRFLDRGLVEPESLTKAVAEYKASADILGQWIEECCEVAAGVEKNGVPTYSEEGPDGKPYLIPVGLAHDSFAAFARRQGLKHTPIARKFSDDMAARGFGRKRLKGLRYLTGLDLRDGFGGAADDAEE